MSIMQSSQEVFYPESDGMPMGETDLHRAWMIRIYDLLAQRYRGQQVYIASDLLLYYQEGFPSHFVVPDVFVVLECEPRMRRTYKIWEEGKVPDVVFEVTSLSTRREDEIRKAPRYRDIGVKELYLYDPTADYLDPPLVGYRLVNLDYEPVREDENGRLISDVLRLTLALEEHRLILVDQTTGARLLTEAETERAARTAEHAARVAAEEEIARLRDELRHRNGS